MVKMLGVLLNTLAILILGLLNFLSIQLPLGGWLIFVGLVLASECCLLIAIPYEHKGDSWQKRK